MLEFNFNPFPVLETERCILNQISKDDAQDMFAMRSDEDIMRYIGRPVAKTIEEARTLIEQMLDGLQKNESIVWAARKKGTSLLIGYIGFWRNEREHYRGEIGYMLHKNFHRQGLMFEIIKPVIQYGFNTMCLHTIMAITDPLNEASQKLLLKSGFSLEAHFKENHFFDGKFLDSNVYGLITPLK